MLIQARKMAGKNTGYRSQVQVTALLIDNWDKQFPLKRKLYFEMWLGLGDKFLFTVAQWPVL